MTIIVNAKDDRAKWLGFFDNVPYIEISSKKRKRKIEIKAEAKPTVEEISEIIEMNAEEDRKSGSWDNVGFVTDTGTTWVDRYTLRTVLSITGSINNKTYKAVELYEEINRRRNEYLSPVLLSNQFDEVNVVNE